MKKILIAMSVAILMALFSAPSFVKAANPDPEWGNYTPAVGFVYMTHRNYNGPVTFTVRCDLSEPIWVYSENNALYTSPIKNNASNNRPLLVYYAMYSSDYIPYSSVIAMYIPTLEQNYTINGVTKIFNNVYDYNDNVPESERLPVPSKASQIWNDYLDLVESVLGYRPLTYSIYDFLFRQAEGENEELTFLTSTPTPTPTSMPTPIPVQTIFVPDGNGNTSIIYQYPDPTTGLITQSPYNPNIENNITVNCDCDSGGGGSGTFTSNPQDPYTLDASLLWADGFGVEMSENPLQATENQQATLKEAAMSYDESVLVMSNSYNILPIKWLSLAGLLGGILIIAGLIRTFLGG